MHSGVDATTSIDCGVDSELCLGQEVLFQCNTTNPFLEWYIPKYGAELDFTNKDKNGCIEMKHNFTAILVGKSGNDLTSELTFYTKKLEDNNTNITCFDGFSGQEQLCTMILAGIVI